MSSSFLYLTHIVFTKTLQLWLAPQQELFWLIGTLKKERGETEERDGGTGRVDTECTENQPDRRQVHCRHFPPQRWRDKMDPTLTFRWWQLWQGNRDMSRMPELLDTPGAMFPDPILTDVMFLVTRRCVPLPGAGPHMLRNPPHCPALASLDWQM